MTAAGNPKPSHHLVHFQHRGRAPDEPGCSPLIFKGRRWLPRRSIHEGAPGYGYQLINVEWLAYVIERALFDGADGGLD